MTKIKQVKIGKRMLTSLGNYSNIEVTHEITAEIGEDESPNYTEIYNQINQNLQIESDNLDPRWIKIDEYNNHYKLTLKLPKRVR